MDKVKVNATLSILRSWGQKQRFVCTVKTVGRTHWELLVDAELTYEVDLNTHTGELNPLTQLEDSDIDEGMCRALFQKATAYITDALPLTEMIKSDLQNVGICHFDFGPAGLVVTTHVSYPSLA